VEKPKYQSVEESRLEIALANVEGLANCERKLREARPVDFGSNDRVLTDDGGEYLFVKCSGGVRLTKYLGSDTDVVVPAEYPIGSGQKVVELERTLEDNTFVRTVRLPATVKSIKSGTFYHCTSLTDMYIPSSVTNLDRVFGLYTPNGCKIHCAEGSAALDYVKEREIAYVIDDSLAVTDDSADDTAKTTYAYISYSADMNERAAEIIGVIEKHSCVVRDGSRLVSAEEIIETVNECSCFIFLISQGYLAGKDIQFFRMASKLNKPKLLYILEACELPPDLSIENGCQQQLRYDSLNEEQRTAKLIDWLQGNGCRHVSSDIPDFDYTATKEGGITLTRYTGSGGEVVIEREYGGLPVKSIGDSAFYRCSSLTAITIPDSVKRVGDSAFSGCSGLTGITIPDSVTSIGKWAFSGCSGLNGISISNRVTSIGDWAFEGCSSLTAITIPDSVTSIGDWAFDGCSSLTAISVNDNNINYCDINGVLFSKDKTLLIAYPGGRNGDYSVPDSVTHIGDSAFFCCSSLTAITIPDSVKSIGDTAFYRCSGLTGITIPDSVTSIGDMAFEDCIRLTVRCSEDSFAWQYCKENFIGHEPLAASEPATHKESAP